MRPLPAHAAWAVALTCFALCIAPCAAAVCYEAYTPHYPTCSGYVLVGYVCHSSWCVADRCIGDCDVCAENKPGMVADFDTGRCVWPPTPSPPTPAPSTPSPPTPVPQTPSPPTPVPETPSPPTPVPETPSPPTPLPETPSPPTPLPETPSPPTPVPSTLAPPTPIPSTPAPETLVPPTVVPPTSIPETLIPFTMQPPATEAPTAEPPVATPEPRVAQTPAPVPVPPPGVDVEVCIRVSPAECTAATAATCMLTPSYRALLKAAVVHELLVGPLDVVVDPSCTEMRDVHNAVATCTAGVTAPAARVPRLAACATNATGCFIGSLGAVPCRSESPVDPADTPADVGPAAADTASTAFPAWAAAMIALPWSCVLTCALMRWREQSHHREIMRAIDDEELGSEAASSFRMQQQHEASREICDPPPPAAAAASASLVGGNPGRRPTTDGTGLLLQKRSSGSTGRAAPTPPLSSSNDDDVGGSTSGVGAPAVGGGPMLRTLGEMSLPSNGGGGPMQRAADSTARTPLSAARKVCAATSPPAAGPHVRRDLNATLTNSSAGVGVGVLSPRALQPAGASPLTHTRRTSHLVPGSTANVLLGPGGPATSPPLPAHDGGTLL